ncbi:DUF6318 family protein [Cellulomonas sp. WB94]|uniref:DUF6318 family protein n=1 Tax=Cellulomonas sp. WB94 TaxID=2173174 RepID=UPI0011B21B5F|nr:DUF6318 family protein [Cellulomonas sp. WB94]
MPRTLPVPDVVSSRAVRFALAAVLALGLLGGCSSGGSAPVATSTSSVPTVVASTTPTAAATPSPTATPKPERPAAMDTVNVDGAIATATYFLELYPYALNTGDISDWNSLSHPECIFCAGLADEVERQVGLSEHQEGLATSIASATGIEVTRGAFFDVDLELTQGPWQVVDKAGTVVEESLPTKVAHIHMNVVRDSGRWLVREAQADLIEE